MRLEDVSKRFQTHDAVNVRRTLLRVAKSSVVWTNDVPACPCSTNTAAFGSGLFPPMVQMPPK